MPAKKAEELCDFHQASFSIGPENRQETTSRQGSMSGARAHMFSLVRAGLFVTWKRESLRFPAPKARNAARVAPAPAMTMPPGTPDGLPATYWRPAPRIRREPPTYTEEEQEDTAGE